MLNGICPGIVLQRICVDVYRAESNPQHSFGDGEIFARTVIAGVQFSHTGKEKRVQSSKRDALFLGHLLFLKKKRLRPGFKLRRKA